MKELRILQQILLVKRENLMLRAEIAVGKNRVIERENARARELDSVLATIKEMLK